MLRILNKSVLLKNSLIFFFSFLEPLNSWILNGLQRFFTLSWLGTLGVILKIVLAVVFIKMLFYSLINMFSRYFLSNSNFKSLYIFAGGGLMQIILICLFHQTLTQVILVMNISLFIILLALLFFCLKIRQAENLKSS